jgi:DnaJ-class molecular chaperone
MLGVPPGASATVIKSRWRALALDGHPDKETDLAKKRAAEERFKLLRRAYDRLLIGDDEDREPAVRGNDLGLVVPVAFLAALRGERVDMMCPDRTVIAVKLPPAATSGQTLRIAGRGAPGSPPGDLLVQLLVLDDPVYRVSKSDPFTLERTQRITWLAAWLGSTVEVDTPWGPTWIDLRPRSREGQVYEIPAHGVRTPERWGALRLQLALDAPPAPERLAPETRDALKAALEAAYAEAAEKVPTR